ncbi:hypothetical protein [Hyphomicrobium sp.]|jgi:hypothetical protein|uniref:hypothetical protein n=1 Tax=Hyphomicrobium sp. TaxID=82 RepID=UPI003569E3E9
MLTSTTTVEQFAYASGIARTKIAFIQGHHRTGLTYVGTYRQIVMFRGLKIALLEELHDAEKLRAFWNLVTAEEGER